MVSSTAAELFDLNDCLKKSEKLALDFLGATQVLSVLNYATSYKDGDKTYFIFPFIDKTDEYFKNSLILKKLYFSSTELENVEVQNFYIFDYAYIKAVSCFTTDLNYIICLFSASYFDFNDYNNNYYYYEIGIYSKDLQDKIEIPLNEYKMVDSTYNFNFFAKCIHLKGEAGAFVFYKATNGVMDTYPIILFKYFDQNSKNFLEYYPSIALNQKTMNNNALLNDLIKISEKKLCFSSTATSKEDLYIVLINLLDENKIVLRYYTINIFQKYTFKFM